MMHQMFRLLVSTFPKLVQIHLDAEFQMSKVDIIHEGHGIYFGLTRNENRIYVAARNLDIHRQTANPKWPTNTILELDANTWELTADPWTLPEFSDLHQIRMRDNLLWVVSGKSPELLAVDPGTRQLVGSLSLSALVPENLRHEAPAAHPSDLYHFNSIYFDQNRLWILAHNWDYGSFALELEYSSTEALLRKPQLIHVHRGLGKTSHDLYYAAGELHVLDSGNGKMLIGNESIELGQIQPEGNPVFPRGLAVSDEYYFIGYGDFSGTRDRRVIGESRIAVVDRRSRRVLNDLPIGIFGNTCDMLLVSEEDWTDSTVPKPDAPLR